MAMEWLNYHHLLYFYVVAREGSIARACEELRLAQPTISGQIRALEESLGEKLFHRVGRRLELTEVGKVALRYAEEIFSLGEELKEVLKGQPKGRPLIVGIADVLPKLVAYRILEPARRLPEPVRIICREGRPERLIADLAVHNLDIVLTDAPISSSIRVKAFHHLLGECGISFFGSGKLALRYRKNFPASLDRAPLLMPSEESAARQILDTWFEQENIKPEIIGEFADSALLQIFAEAGDGIFPAPSVLEDQLKSHHGLQLIGRAEKLRERYYVISIERKLRHPAVIAISESARKDLFVR